MRFGDTTTAATIARAHGPPRRTGLWPRPRFRTSGRPGPPTRSRNIVREKGTIPPAWTGIHCVPRTHEPAAEEHRIVALSGPAAGSCSDCSATYLLVVPPEVESSALVACEKPMARGHPPIARAIPPAEFRTFGRPGPPWRPCSLSGSSHLALSWTNSAARGTSPGSPQGSTLRSHRSNSDHALIKSVHRFS